MWFRWVDDAFEVVIVKGDVKLRHLARDPRCVLVVFEAVRRFRGLEVRGAAELVEGDVTSARAAIAERYLGVGDGEHFAAERRSTPGVLTAGAAGAGRRAGVISDTSRFLPLSQASMIRCCNLHRLRSSTTRGGHGGASSDARDPG